MHPLLPEALDILGRFTKTGQVSSAGLSDSARSPIPTLAAPPPGQLPDLSAELLAAYLMTEVVQDGGRVWSGAGAGPLEAPVWVITAENPWSERQDGEANEAAMADLEQTLVGAGLAPVRLVGRAPDGSWSEDCFAVAVGHPASGADAAHVLGWGRDRGQHAVFLLTTERHTVVQCATGSELATRPRVLPPR